MDVRRKQKNETTFTPLCDAWDCPRQASLLESSEQTALEKGRRMGERSHLSSQKFQEENKMMKKESLSQLSEKDQGPKLRERRVNFSEIVTDLSASCEALSLDVPAEESMNSTDSHSAYGLKESPMGRQLRHSSDAKKKCVDGMSPKTRLNLLNAELEELNKKCKKIEEEFESAEKELLDSKRDVSPKIQNVRERGVDTSKKYCELQALRNDLSKKATNVKNLTKELQQAKEVIHKLNLENRDLKETIKKLKQQMEVGTALIKDEMKLCYDLEMEKIRDELDAIKSELRIEKTLQARNNRALELLRKHFVSIRPSAPLGPFPGDVFKKMLN
ncbi:PREDICTED: coiled-coil domain-containing protein 160 [Elephantulus edwardii]|uniref:coiled-coil domain-containing protein 160 n=1 Tax=Elephantulus edwardii TaxID=28737 RepID=UPI0003F061F6|nr:PREDICTED: coiled-coil domain-containing protein 160 [Elephantulus edwardii]